ncbi:MAG: hypothetical protein R3F43_18135 [bacterium]
MADIRAGGTPAYWDGSDATLAFLLSRVEAGRSGGLHGLQRVRRHPRSAARGAGGPVREPLWRPALVFAAVGGFLAWTALPGLHWHDAEEAVRGSGLAAVGLILSQAPAAHPDPRGVQEIPLGDGVFRAGIASALALALALSIFYSTLRRLAPQAAWWAAAAHGHAPSGDAGHHSCKEPGRVYALQLLLATAGALALSVAEGDRRALPASGWRSAWPAPTTTSSGWRCCPWPCWRW